jgi:hypothetical protein
MDAINVDIRVSSIAGFRYNPRDLRSRKCKLSVAASGFGMMLIAVDTTGGAVIRP